MTRPDGYPLLVNIYRAARDRQALLDQLHPDSQEAEQLRSALAEHDRQARAFAVRLAGADHDPDILLSQAHEEAGKLPVRPVAAQSSHCAVCPVAGCGKELPISSEQADRVYLCPCPNRAELHVGRREDGWTLHLPPPTQEQRETINRIAHALFTGQGYADPGRHRPVLTAADANSTRMVEAFRTAHALARQCAYAVRAGQLERAAELAERYAAAEVAQRTHERRYAQARREHQRTGRWHDTETFWLNQPDPYTPGQPLRRYTFELVAVWDEAGATPVVLNGPEIERQAGMEVGAEAWRQLVALLTRAESKPGTEADNRELVYRSHKGSLVLRDHVKKRFPEAVVALEALRRCLVVEV